MLPRAQAWASPPAPFPLGGHVGQPGVEQLSRLSRGVKTLELEFGLHWPAHDPSLFFFTELLEAAWLWCQVPLGHRGLYPGNASGGGSDLPALVRVGRAQRGSTVDAGVRLCDLGT